jgi:hypothetical protein
VEHAGLLANLAPGIERARVQLYKGIDAHAFLPRLARTLGLDDRRAAAPPVPPVVPPVVAPASQVLPHGGPNPFQKAGTLAADAASYVRRAADAALTAGLAEHALLVVRGEFSIGKSSLLLRSDRYWERGAEAALCRLDLMDMRIDDVNLFYDEFFTAIGDCYGQAFTGWKEISAAIERRPLLLTIDEFSGMTEEVAQRFVPALHRLGTRHGAQLRIVVTTREPFEAVLAGFHLNNPNLGDWHTVELVPFCEAELGALLGLLPRRAQAAALGQIEAVRRLSGMAPKRAQCLCFNLFKDELAGRTEAELAARVTRMESYR